MIHTHLSQHTQTPRKLRVRAPAGGTPVDRSDFIPGQPGRPCWRWQDHKWGVGAGLGPVVGQAAACSGQVRDHGKQCVWLKAEGPVPCVLRHRDLRKAKDALKLTYPHPQGREGLVGIDVCAWKP
jgi:hypothetical protein